MSNGIKDLLQQARPMMFPRAPLFLRQFGADLAGNFLRDKLGLETLGNLVGSREINRGDLSPSEYKTLQESTARALQRGGPGASLTYDDYGLDDLTDYVSIVAGGAVPQKMQSDADTRKAEWVQGLLDQGYTQQGIDELYAQGPFARAKSAQQLKDLEGGMGPFEALLSSPSAFSLAGTIGGASIRKDPETGEYWIDDEYDFNDAANLPEDASFWEDAAKEGFAPTFGNLYGQARNLAKYYGSQPGEGSPVRINLGDLEHLLNPEEDKPGLFSRGLAYLGNLLKREREPSLVQAGPSVADGTSVPPAMSEVDRLKKQLEPVVNPNMTELDIRRAEAEAMKDLVLDEFNFDR